MSQQVIGGVTNNYITKNEHVKNKDYKGEDKKDVKGSKNNNKINESDDTNESLNLNVRKYSNCQNNRKVSNCS